jgi:glycosyltransferase involved in cell wall biosynthesis
MGGQSVQASRLFTRLRGQPELSVTFQPTISCLRWFQNTFGRIRYLRTLMNALIYVPSLVIRIPRNDVVHVFSAGNASFLLVTAPALILGRLFSKKVILHYHDGRARDHLERWPVTVRLCRLAHEIITPTTFLVDVFARFGLVARPIPNMLDVRAYPFRERRAISPAFIHNRALEDVYDVECTLRAFQIIQARYPEASLTIAHDGSLRSKLEVLVQSLQLRKVTFTGSVSQRRMARLYDTADIYLSSARHDNMPGSLLEAFAAGLPVVATRAGGTSWILRDQENGLSVPCGDHRAMADAAIRLLEDEDLVRRLVSRAKQEARIYPPSEIGTKWAQLYASLSGKVNTRSYQLEHLLESK